jgi:hypothetical protein
MFGVYCFLNVEIKEKDCVEISSYKLEEFKKYKAK